MTKPSTRNAATARVPEFAGGSATTPRARSASIWARTEAALAAGVADWIAHDARLTAMQLEWQTYERAVFDKAKRLNLSCEQACLSDWPEARAMRELDVQIMQSRHQLEVEAGRLQKDRAATLADALAKIELGLKVQGPFDWREHALDLIQDGLAELRHMTSGPGA